MLTRLLELLSPVKGVQDLELWRMQGDAEIGRFVLRLHFIQEQPAPH